MGKMSLNPLDDFAAIRGRLESLPIGRPLIAMVLQHIEHPSNAVITNLLDRGVHIALYIEDPADAPPELQKQGWDRIANIIPDFAGHERGGLDVWLVPNLPPFNATWIEGQFIAIRLHDELGVDTPQVSAPVDVGQMTIAEAGTPEYNVLTKIVYEFADRAATNNLGPQYVISEGNVLRAMGDH
ncbi:MAG TPA: hypothetical protein VFI05_04630 [Nitrospiraceae bacterium]|nr:hypothetical protein [Nitrospiraceae bacterium]